MRITKTIAAVLILANAASSLASDLAWVSPNAYRTLLTVDPKTTPRSNAPVSFDIDFAQLLAGAGANGPLDQDTIEVVAYDAGGAPKVFDGSRVGYEQYLLPWRVELAYKLTGVTLHFVMPDHSCTRFAVYYDTVQSGKGKPQRYRGLVGDGDWFSDGYARREVNACSEDCWCDFDGDGDLDLFKCGNEPYVYCYENMGGGRMVDRGRLTSAGQVLELVKDGNHRTAGSIELFDWDGDGDLDMFMWTPIDAFLYVYENVSNAGGLPAFAAPFRLYTASGKPLNSIVNFVDWDGDGKTDLLGGQDLMLVYYRNVGSNNDIRAIQLADGQYIKANGVDIQVMGARADAKDIDNDGDLDLFVATTEGRVFFYGNVGSRSLPVFIMGRPIAFYEYMDAIAGVTVADFDADGLLDFIPGRYWERTQWGEQPRVYGRMYKNIGTPTAPKFEARDAYHGAPYTERFQRADAVRQNGVRAVDWDNDGKTDLIASDTDGFVWFFRNTTNHLFPVFAPGVKVQAAGQPLRVFGEDGWYDDSSGTFIWLNRAGGHARVDICDWNNDGRKDLLVADARAWLWIYLNTGTDANPVLDAGTRVMANGKPIDGSSRSSVLVCDWNNDGKKDVIFAMSTDENAYSEYHDWPSLPGNWWDHGGFLFYRNTGSDDNPVLAAPTWLKAGPGAGSVIIYSRPNLGNFIDWDGDGKKDFIGCQFENTINFYKNTGSGGPNSEPQLANPVALVSPATVQMCSGADAIDWNRDGDLDILSGQGHGGSNLRFYERDYINDFVNQNQGLNTWPVVTIGTTEARFARPDFDQDEDVDQSDFGHLQECFTGEGFPYEPGCAAADLDTDTDVDGDDFDIFQRCLSSPGQPANLNCAD